MQNDGVFLRELRESDLEKINMWRNDFDLKKLTLGIRFPITMALDIKWFQTVSSDTQNKAVYFAIETIEDKFVGLIQLMSIDWINRTADVGIIIGDKNSRGKKIGYKSLKLLLNYAFNVLNLYKVSSHISELNDISISLFKSCGFIEEGKLKEQICYGDQRSDLIIMSINQNDFFQPND